MANQSYLDILKQGVGAWNSWREQNRYIEPDLRGAHLSEAHLTGANLFGADLRPAQHYGKEGGVERNYHRSKLLRAKLSKADLRGANLTAADLYEADLTGANLFGTHLFEASLRRAKLSKADLHRANLSGTDLSWANLSGADLRGAHLSRADLSGADLSGTDLSGADLFATDLRGANLSEANLSGANLKYSALVGTNLTGATLTGCSIYGISAWNLNLEGTKQQNLNVSIGDEPAIMVDNLEVAQFVYLLLNNEKIRQVIDTITSKVVLILGRFTSDRKAILDAIRDELRQHGYLPILFDFEKPAGRDLTETISTLAHMARFIIADITDAKSIPQELQAIVPNLPSVPVQPLLLTSQREYGMFEHFKRYPWVLDTYYYDNVKEVLASLEDKVISPAETKVRELVG